MNEIVRHRVTTANLTVRNEALQYPFDDGVGTLSIHRHVDGLVTLNVTREPVSMTVFVDSEVIETLKRLITWYDRSEAPSAE